MLRAGRWPDDAAAFAKARAALGCQLAEAVAGAYGLRAVASEACVDVFADGFAFRLFLHSERRVLACDVAKLLMHRHVGSSSGV